MDMIAECVRDVVRIANFSEDIGQTANSFPGDQEARSSGSFLKIKPNIMDIARSRRESAINWIKPTVTSRWMPKSASTK